MHLCDIVTALYIRYLLTWLVFILNKNTIIVYISNLHQTSYTVLVNILVLVIIQSPF